MTIVNRISTNYAFIRSMRNLNDITLRMDAMRQEMATGKEVNRPSDDPVAMQKIFSFGSSLKLNERLQENIDLGTDRLEAAGSRLEQVEEILLELIDVVTQAGSSITSSAEWAVHATQVELWLGELVNVANSAHQNKFLFGGVNTVSGTSPQPLPYNIVLRGDGFISGVVPHTNGINNLVSTTILPGVRDTINISGQAPFQPNGQGQTGDVFNVLVNLRDSFRSNDIVGIRASEQQLTDALETVMTQNTIIGSKVNKMSVGKDSLEAMEIEETAARSRVADAEYAELLLKFSTAELMLNTTLSATSTLLQNSLINFI